MAALLSLLFCGGVIEFWKSAGLIPAVEAAKTKLPLRKTKWQKMKQPKSLETKPDANLYSLVISFDALPWIYFWQAVIVRGIYAEAVAELVTNTTG